MPGLKLITPPAAEPVLLADAKLHLRVVGTDDDTLITALIVAARADCEQRIERSLIAQTWEMSLDAFEDAILLPMAPVSAIASVKYIDGNGVEQTLSSGGYALDNADDYGPHYLVLAYGATWPAPREQANAVKIRYSAGYGADGTFVPEAIKQWIKLRVGALYAQRESIVVGQPIAAAPRDFFDGLLDRYKLWSLA